MAQKWLDPKETPNIISIEYPAVVEDEEKAISCLGGMETINKVIFAYQPVFWYNL